MYVTTDTCHTSKMAVVLTPVKTLKGARSSRLAIPKSLWMPSILGNNDLEGVSLRNRSSVPTKGQPQLGELGMG